MQLFLKFAKYKCSNISIVYQKSAIVKKIVLTLLCAALAASVVPAQTKGQADLRLSTVVLDAGHGGKDAGTVSLDGKTYEKTIALSIAKKAAAKIREECPGVKVVLTRDKDEFIPLGTRAKKATDAGANLFISIHVNAAAKGKTASGFSAYILGNGTKYNSYDVNMEVIKRENSVIYLEDDYSTRYKDLDGTSPESQIFLKLMLSAFREQSLSFAEKMCSQMAAGGPFHKDLGVLQGNFQVLRQASMPAVLLEFGYMSNDDDLAHLRDEKDIDRMVDNLVAAFKEYKKSYDESVTQSNEKTPSESTKAEKKPEPVKTEDQTAAAQADGAYYGVQVLASSKSMVASDRFFKGYPMTPVKSGNLYRYLLCTDPDVSKVKASYSELKNTFPDSFIVRVEGGEVTRYRQ